MAADAPAPDHEVVVIGAGPGGIGAGVRLKQAGIEDFAILERAGDIGGSWRDNTYPGIGVDIPSIAYQYAFARKADWSRVFASGAEVKAYHDEVAQRFGLLPHIRLNTEVVREEWDDAAHVWRLRTAQGDTISARFVINAVGAFLREKDDPGIDGVEDFAGQLQRPSRWDHDYDHRGKRVAIIGTGASSVQIVPAIAPEVERLYVHQRTPVWCLPKPDARIPPPMQSALAIPGVAAALHGVVLAGAELVLRAAVDTPQAVAKPAMRLLDRAARAGYRNYLRGQVKDPKTRAALTPDYGPLGKRPTLSNSFVQAFNRPNTKLVTEPIERVTSTGIRTADGVERDVDMIVLATGYHLFSDPESYPPGTVVGRDGFDLGEFFARERLQAYESVSLPGLPNRWMVVGPYSWTGTGWHALVDISLAHAVRAITHGRRSGATAIEVRREAHERYHAEVQRRGRNIAFYFGELNAGLRTYYVNSQGDMPYIRPSSVLQARRASTHFPLSDYRFSTLTAATAVRRLRAVA